MPSVAIKKERNIGFYNPWKSGGKAELSDKYSVQTLILTFQTLILTFQTKKMEK